MRFQAALGSAREVQACLQVASAWGYLEEGAEDALASVDIVIAMLFKLVRARQQPTSDKFT